MWQVCLFVFNTCVHVLDMMFSICPLWSRSWVKCADNVKNWVHNAAQHPCLLLEIMHTPILITCCHVTIISPLSHLKQPVTIVSQFAWVKGVPTMASLDGPGSQSLMMSWWSCQMGGVVISSLTRNGGSWYCTSAMSDVPLWGAYVRLFALVLRLPTSRNLLWNKKLTCKKKKKKASYMYRSYSALRAEGRMSQKGRLPAG